jgi:hypothetical protein
MAIQHNMAVDAWSRARASWARACKPRTWQSRLSAVCAQVVADASAVVYPGPFASGTPRGGALGKARMSLPAPGGGGTASLAPPASPLNGHADPHPTHARRHAHGYTAVAVADEEGRVTRVPAAGSGLAPESGGHRAAEGGAACEAHGRGTEEEEEGAAMEMQPLRLHVAAGDGDSDEGDPASAHWRGRGAHAAGRAEEHVIELGPAGGPNGAHSVQAAGSAGTHAAGRDAGMLHGWAAAAGGGAPAGLPPRWVRSPAVSQAELGFRRVAVRRGTHASEPVRLCRIAPCLVAHAFGKGAWWTWNGVEASCRPDRPVDEASARPLQEPGGRGAGAAGPPAAGQGGGSPALAGTADGDPTAAAAAAFTAGAVQPAGAIGERAPVRRLAARLKGVKWTNYINLPTTCAFAGLATGCARPCRRRARGVDGLVG